MTYRPIQAGTAGLLALTALASFAADSPPEKSATPPASSASSDQSGLQSAGSLAVQAIKKIDPSNAIFNESLEVINLILDTSRKDQNLVYLFARAVNRNMDLVDQADKAFVDSVRGLTSKLMDASYGDALHQNANLSDQIKTRLPLLIADSAKIARPTQGEAIGRQKEDFLRELKLLTERFLKSGKFRIGIGASYIYFPSVSYASAPDIDLTGFQSPDVLRSGGRSVFLVDFGRRGSPALALSSRIPFAQLDVVFPVRTDTKTITTSVERFAKSSTASMPDILARTTVTSQSRPVFDAAISLSVGDLLELSRTRSNEPDVARKFDVYLGVGTTGYRIQETALTDVRIRSDAAKTFDELGNSGNVSSSKSLRFHAPYLKVSAGIQVSDEVQIGVTFRQYRRSTIDSGDANVGGKAVGLYGIWYPTFKW